MKKFIFVICAFALVACSEENNVAQNSATQVKGMAQGGAQVDSARGDMPSLESATDLGNMKLEQSPYNFSSMEALRESILLQAQKENLSLEEVAAGIDELASKLITENFERLSESTTEAEAEEAMMKLFMRAMGAKTLKIILNIGA